MALSSIAGVSNVTLWNMARKEDPSFASHTSEGTAETFTEKGFEAISRNNINVVNEFFEVSLRVAFQMLNVARARNPLADSGLVEVYNTPNGGYTQRMAVGAVKPVTPSYRDLVDGSSVDPFVVRKPDVTERFYQQNFDFQNLITYQDFNAKTIFINEYGVGQLLAGILEGVQAAYTKQEYYNTLECLNAAINSTATPLQNSQVIRTSSWTDGAPTVAELTDFIKIAKNIIRDLDSTASSSKYNASRFDSVVGADDLVMLCRPSILTDIDAMNALNRPDLGIDMSVRGVENFGGMTPYIMLDDDDDQETDTVKTPLYPAYNSLGVQIGWNAEEGQNVAEYSDAEISWDDPNSEVLAVVAQRGVIFENAQNPYTVEPIWNPRGMYRNFWANRPGTAIVYDSYRDLIVIAKPATA